MAKERSENSDEKKKPPSKTPVWEWIVAALGLILVAGSVCVTVYRAATEESTPPIISIDVDSVSQTESGFLVRFTVKNTGNQTAADLNIEGELTNGEEKVEASSTGLTYAPSNSTRKGGLFFSKNPDDYELRIRPTGYAVP